MNKIVLVNNNSLQLKLQEKYLEDENFKVYPFENAFEASLFLNENENINIIITALHLPLIDGWQFCQLLRSKEFVLYNNIPILIVSETSEDIDLNVLSQTIGANTFLKAPYSKKKYISSVNKLISLNENFYKILIIDDKNIEADKYLKELNDLKYNFKLSDSINNAIIELESFVPDYILINHFIDNKNIIESIPIIKKYCSGSIIVVMTEDLSLEKVVEILQNQADSYIEKPFTAQYLNTLLTEIKKIKNIVRSENLIRHKELLLKTTHSWYKKLLSFSNIILFKLNEKCEMIYINEVGKKTLNITQSLKNKNILTDIIIKDLELLQKEGIISNKKISFILDNEEKSLLLNIFVKKTHNKFFYIEGIALDITELNKVKNKLTENQHFYQNFFNSLPDYIALSDNNGNLLYSNNSHNDFILKCEDNFVFTFKNLTEDEKIKMISLFEKVKTSGSSSGKIVFTDGNNNKRYTYIRFSIIKGINNKTKGIVQIIHEEEK